MQKRKTQAEPFAAHQTDGQAQRKPQDDFAIRGTLSSSNDMPEQYHELWDMCLLIKAKVKDYKDVIKMNVIANPSALEIADRVRTVVAPDDFVNEALNRRNELLEFQRYVERQNQKTAQSENQKGKAEGMEKMIIMAIQSSVPTEAIETMRKGAGITEARFAELMNQAKKN